MRWINMVYLKSICVGLAFVLGAFYAISYLIRIVLLFVARPGQNAVGFFISLHSPSLWLSSLLIFVAGFFWAYRRFSR